MTLPASTPHAAVFTPRPDEVGQLKPTVIGDSDSWSYLSAEIIEQASALRHLAMTQRRLARSAESYGNLAEAVRLHSEANWHDAHAKRLLADA